MDDYDDEGSDLGRADACLAVFVWAVSSLVAMSFTWSGPDVSKCLALVFLCVMLNINFP